MAVTNLTNFVNEGTFSTTDRQGYQMSFNNTTKITKVTVIAAVSPTTAYILNHSSHAQIASASFSGQIATFASPVDVAAANDYDVIVDGGGGSWGSSYKNDYNLPANNTDINFILIVYYNGSWATSTASPVGGIESVTTDAGSSGPANLKSYNTNLKANIKSMNTNLIANVKSFDTNV